MHHGQFPLRNTGLENFVGAADDQYFCWLPFSDQNRCGRVDPENYMFIALYFDCFSFSILSIEYTMYTLIFLFSVRIATNHRVHQRQLELALHSRMSGIFKAGVGGSSSVRPSSSGLDLANLALLRNF